MKMNRVVRGALSVGFAVVVSVACLGSYWAGRAEGRAEGVDDIAIANAAIAEVQMAGFTILDQNGREVVSIDFEQDSWTHTTR